MFALFDPMFELSGHIAMHEVNCALSKVKVTLRTTVSPTAATAAPFCE